MDVLVHDLVDVDKVHALAVVGNHLFDEGAALQSFLVTEVEGLCGIEKLDGEDAFGVLGHALALGGCVGAHTHKVFLVLAAGNTVHAARRA